MKKLRVIFTGGGTGGHVYPNIAIYESLCKDYPQSEFLYIGTEKGAESKIVKGIQRPIRFVNITSKGIPDKIKSFSTIVSFAFMMAGTVKSFFVIRKFKPDIVIGSGGYVAAPVLFAASILKKKIFIHEQNAVPGRLNRLMTKFAKSIAVSFPVTLDYLPKGKGIYTGYPVRDMIILKDRVKMKQKLGIPEKNKVVFIFGGSKGARTINIATANILPELMKRKNLTVILSTGRNHSAEYKAYESTIKLIEKNNIDPDREKNLIVREYFDNIDEIYSVADIVVSRAGAGSIEEITKLGIPSILIPKIDLPGDHQIVNAKEIEKTGGARIVFEKISANGDPHIYVQEKKLLLTIDELLQSEVLLDKMRSALKNKTNRKDAVKKIISIIKELTGEVAKEETEEIVSYYLHMPGNEKNLELIFSATTIGNSFLSSYYIDNSGPGFMFEVKTVGKEEKLILRRIRGEIEVNGHPVKKITEIFEEDTISANDQKFILKKYFEKVEKLNIEKGTQSKMIGSSLGIFFSRVGGFFREIVIVSLFGAKGITDIYVAGLMISNLMRRIVAENALENAFLPIFMRLFRRSPRDKMWKSASSVLNFTLLFSLLITITGIIFAPAIIGLVYYGFESRGVMAETVAITRLMFPYLVLVTIAAIFSTILKAFNRFGIAELSSLFFSVGSITGILALYSISHLYALGAGVLLGGMLHAAFLYPFVKKILKNKSLQFKYYPVINFSSSVNKKYYSQLTPISLDVFLSKTSEIVDQFLAAGLKTGSLSYLYFAKTIFRLPFAIISQAINSVILRDFSDKIALFNKDKTKKLFVEGIKINIFLLAPVSIIMLILAEPIVSLLYGRGKFLIDDIKNTSYVLKFYSIGLIGWGLHSLTTRIFSARIDIKSSMYLNFMMLLSNIGLSFYLVETELKFAGLALASTISFLTFAFIRIFVLKIKLAEEEIKLNFRELIIPFIKTIIASFFMVVVMLQSKIVFSLINVGSIAVKNFIIIVSLSFIGISIYLITSLLLKNTDILIFKKRKVKSVTSVPLNMLSPFMFLEHISSDPLRYKDEFGYKTDIFLNSKRWEIRNVGIKLTGMFKIKENFEYLKHNIMNKTGNGFIRRNSLRSLKNIMEWNEESKIILQTALSDSYYEVRVAAIDAITEHIVKEDYFFFNGLAKENFEKASTEEKISYIKLFTVTGSHDELDFLSKYFLAENSLIREELLKMILSFYRKGILNKVDMIKFTDKILLTSNNMKPHFKLKAILSEIYSEIEKI